MERTIEPDTHLRGRGGALARYAWYACAFIVAIVLFGALPGYYSHYAQATRSDPYGLGQFNLPFQVLVGLSDLASGFISFALAALLFWRKPNDRMALFASFFFLITAVASGYALDYFLTAYFGAPSTYQLGSNLQTPLWILLLCIFPDGRFVPRWTRWLFLVSIPISFSLLAGGEWQIIFIVVTFSLFILVTYAQVYRYRRVSSYVERRQTKWVVFGLLVSMGLSLIASIIYKKPSPPLLNIIPFALTIAILRSHLWDIDLLINRTLVYVPLTGIIAGIFAASITLSQRFFIALTGQSSDAATGIATLLTVAAFDPLKTRLQALVDKRFKEAPDPAKKLKAFEEQVRTRLYPIGVMQGTRRLLEEAVAAFEAKGGAAYLESDGNLQLIYTAGEWKGDTKLSVSLASSENEAKLGVVALGARRNGAPYREQECEALQHLAQVVAQAIEQDQSPVRARLSSEERA
jgi:hypothetical protein